MDAPMQKTSPLADRNLESAIPFDVQAFVAKFGGVAGLKFNSGQSLFRQGDPADCMYYIERGQIQFVMTSAHGKEAIVLILGPGEFCGTGIVVGKPLRAWTAMCSRHSTVARLDKAAVLRAVEQDPEFCRRLLLYAMTRAARLAESLLSHLFDNSEQRLARTLLVLANFDKGRQREQIVGKIDQEALARMIGTTRSRVSHFMNKFRRLGHIDYNGHINVRSSLLNVLVHEDSRDDDSASG